MFFTPLRIPLPHLKLPDPDDLIFPRAATRVGLKYQAVCPPLIGNGTNSSQRGALEFLTCLTLPT
jgi:hypothetical protein